MAREGPTSRISAKNKRKASTVQTSASPATAPTVCTETDAGIVGAAAQLVQLGLRPKNLRVVKSAVDREIGLIEQVLLPALKSNRQERRREGLEQLDDIVQATTQLRQLLLTRGVRRLTGGRDAR